MNIVEKLNEQYTYSQIAQRIQQTTGRCYSVGHLGNIARGSAPMNDKLMFNLMRSFPEFFLTNPSPVGDIIAQLGQTVHNGGAS